MKYFERKNFTVYPSLKKPIAFMYFQSSYCDKNHIERIPVAVKDIDHLSNLAGEIIKAGRPPLFLLSDGTQINDNEYLSSLENGTELIDCTEEQIRNCKSILN